jgi:hypothetical protein
MVFIINVVKLTCGGRGTEKGGRNGEERRVDKASE